MAAGPVVVLCRHCGEPLAIVTDAGRFRIVNDDVEYGFDNRGRAFWKCPVCTVSTRMNRTRSYMGSIDEHGKAA